MRALLVATSAAPADAPSEIGRGRLPRIDYLEAARCLPARYIDYRATGGRNWVEDRCRLDVRHALQVAHEVRAGAYDVVFSLSERVGIPLAGLLPRHVRQVVLGHHLLSAAKLRLLAASGVPARWHLTLTPTRAEAAALGCRLHLPPDRVRWLPNPIDTRFFDPARAAPPDDGGAPGGGPGDYVLSVGLSYRDYPTLIRALGRLPGVPGHLYVGSTWSPDSAANEGGALPANVSVYGSVHPCALRQRYADSRFVVVPLRPTTLWSAGSTVLLQAQAMGKAVVATRTPGIADYVLEGETGLLVAPGDPAAMAAAIAALWDAPGRAAAMGRRAREWVAATFSLDDWLARVAGLLLSGERVGDA